MHIGDFSYNVSATGLGGGRVSGNTTIDVGAPFQITNPNLALLNSRTSDITQPVLPEIFNMLTEPAKKEFEAFWKLVESIKSNKNAHKLVTSFQFSSTELADLLRGIDARHKLDASKFPSAPGYFSSSSNRNAPKLGTSNLKLLITNEPLELSHFLLNVKDSNFQLEVFLRNLGITLENSFLNNAKLNNAKLNNAKLNRAMLNGAELKGAMLNDAKLKGAELIDAKLNDAWLHRAVLYCARLNDAELNGARLHRARLNSAKLYGARLNDAELFGAQLGGAKLDDAKLDGAWLNCIGVNQETKFDETTSLKNIKCQCIHFTEKDKEGKPTLKVITNQDEIREKFIELGAKKENISFAQAA